MAKSIKLKDSYFLNGEIYDMTTNSNGTYVKWANGFMVCWRRVQIKGLNTSEFYGETFLFPASFLSGQDCNVSMTQVSNGGSWASLRNNCVPLSDGTGCNLTFYNAEQTWSSSTSWWDIIAVGKWK